MNLQEAKEILRKKGYTVHRLNECGGSVNGCGGSSSYSSGCGSSYSSGCGGSSSSYSSGCGGSSNSYSSGCGTISRSIRVGCGSGGYISNSCYSNHCGSYYYDDDKHNGTQKTISVKGIKYEFAGYNSYYGCAEYTNSKLGKTILDVYNNKKPHEFSKIISLARKLRISEVRTVEIIETLYESGISREIAYNLLAKLDMIPEKLLRMPITHVK